MTTRHTATLTTDATIAEWVGLHYFMNFDAMNTIGKADWRQRYAEAHAADTAPAVAYTFTMQACINAADVVSVEGCEISEFNDDAGMIRLGCGDAPEWYFDPADPVTLNEDGEATVDTSPPRGSGFEVETVCITFSKLRPLTAADVHSRAAARG